MLDAARPLGRIFPMYYVFRHKIRDAKLEAVRAIVNAALARIEQERQSRAYLVGDAFTVTDVTAAAMLGALLRPPETQYPLRVELPPYLQRYRTRAPATSGHAVGGRNLSTASRQLVGSVTVAGSGVVQPHPSRAQLRAAAYRMWSSRRKANRTRCQDFRRLRCG